MGGLVTTYKAGMAVPDWPGTYGYNLFLYPLESWIKVWDVFLEHSHRLIGAALGFFTIALAVALLWRGPKSAVRWLGLVAVAAVSLQGVLGGLRVLGNEVLLANVHGCTAPLVFALMGALVAFTSPRWAAAPARDARHDNRTWTWLSLCVTAGLWIQIVLGAQLRHPDPTLSAGWSLALVWLHLITAGLLLAAIVSLAVAVFRRARGQRVLVRRAGILLGLYVLQVILGCATWITKYNWPPWFTDYIWPFRYTVESGGAVQAVTVTAHVAVGSLCLVAALSLSLWMLRLPMSAVKPREPESPETRGWLGNVIALVRLRIVAMVLLTMLIAGIVAAGGSPPWGRLLHALSGSALVIVGAIVFNQRLERESDARMPRTARRPLAAGQLSVRTATWLAATATAAGLLWLVLAVNLSIVALAAVSWLLYVWVYTPLKPRTVWQTPIGAVPGALPTLLGSAAVEATWNAEALVLFAIVYLWQFPHAMAIAWIYRDQFAAAHMKLVTVVEPSGRTAAWLSIVGAAILVPVGLVPCWTGSAGWVYALVAIAVNGAYLAAAIMFLRSRDETTARRMLRASFLHLPVVCLAVLVSVLTSGRGP